MYNNYQYFLTLAEEGNISRAAERLFVTHQCLSKYISNLEAEYGVTLFERKPTLTLTYAGKLMLDTLRQAESLNINLKNQYANLRQDLLGEVHIGTTEGRFRILMPDIISDFKQAFPSVQLRISSAPSPELVKMLQQNHLDLIIVNGTEKLRHMLTTREVLRERLYFVISDGMLEEYFPDTYPQCKVTFQQGVDLRLFQRIPVALNLPQFNSHMILDRHLSQIGAELNCIHTSSHPDLHHAMSARDYAASFCLTMYLSNLRRLNRETGNHLNVFPVLNLEETNPVVIAHMKNRIFPHYTAVLMRIIRRRCQEFKKYDLPLPSQKGQEETN